MGSRRTDRTTRYVFVPSSRPEPSTCPPSRGPGGRLPARTRATLSHGRAAVVKRGSQRDGVFGLEFPEGAGERLGLLNAVGGNWNISMFHYHNRGFECGGVVGGIQVAQAGRGPLLVPLKELGSEYDDESENPAYR